MNSKAIFVTGTDTGVGKTIVCGLLAKYFLREGYQVITQKWIQTGANSDIDLHLRFMGKTKKDFFEYLSYMTPYSFKFPSSPHLAANLEKKKIDADKIKRTFEFLLKKFDFVIVEGIGGVLVPYTSKNLVIDIVKELNLSVLIVVKNRLGAINHTLLTIEAMRKRKIKILGILFNNFSKRENEIILKDNPRIIKRITGEVILGILPYSKNQDFLFRAFIPIGDKIIYRLKWIDG